MCDELVRCVCDGRGDRYCVGLSAVFFYPLFIEEEEGFFFALHFSSLVFQKSLVCSCVYSLFGVVLFALHVLLYHIHEQTLFISSAFIKRDFLLRSNRLIDYFFSLCFRFPPLLRSTVALVVSVPVHLSFLERGDQGDEFSLFFFLLLQRLDFE